MLEVVKVMIWPASSVLESVGDDVRDGEDSCVLDIMVRVFVAIALVEAESIIITFTVNVPEPHDPPT